ncbi:MAG TPA: ABC transporter permease, partial [Candidatus Acidoferrales bacterium]
MAVFRDTTFTLTGGEEPQRIRGSLATANLFQVLGVGPQLGRGFLPEEDRPGGQSVCVISHGLWQRRFGAAPDAIGQTLRLEDNPCEVVGVTPARFNFPDDTIDVLLPLRLPPGEREWGTWSFFGVARLKGEAPPAQAQAEVNTIARSFAEHMPFGAGWEFVLTPLDDRVVGGVRKDLWVLFGTTGFVLLIASVNLANLLLARMHGRSRELAVRAALGAGRGRLLRQLLGENLMLALLGAALSVALAAWVVDVFRWLAPSGFPRMDEIAVDGSVLVFAVAASLLAVLAAGIVPARQVMRRGLAAGLREGGGARGIAGGRTRAQDTLVATEVALAVVLLMGAGLLLRSLHQLLNVNMGMTSENVLTMIIQLPPRYAEAAPFTFFRDLERRIQSLPSVAAVGVTTGLPTQGVQVVDSLTVEGAPPVDPDARPNVAIDVASAGYFQAAGIPLLDGELFTAQGVAVPGGIVINQAIARRYFPGRSAVGKRVLSADDKTWL